jgi:gliding motility-associated-like protein
MIKLFRTCINNLQVNYYSGLYILKTFVFLTGLLFNFTVHSQEITGIWTGSGSIWTTSICDINITTSVSGLQNGASITFDPAIMGCNIPNTYSSNNIFSSHALAPLLSFGSGGKGVLTFTFDKHVKDPILHIDRLGGGYGFDPYSNSALITLITPGITLTKLSGNGMHFEVTSNTITRTPDQSFGSTTTSECGIPTVGGSAGSVRINGIVSEVSFEFELNGMEGFADGIEVIWELTSCALDFDQDGILDEFDLDDDNDGILDTVEMNGNPNLDTDNDGLIDSYDLDSDNDGCFDVTEAGFDDPDNNGILGSLPDSVDSDGLIINEPNGYTAPLDYNSNNIFDFQEALQPLVISQPKNSFTLCEQDNLIIPISVSNSLNVEWQVSTDFGLTWLDLVNDSIFSGVSTENLELTIVPLSYNGYWFRAKLDKFCNSHVYTDILELNVLKIPDAGEDGEKTFCMDGDPRDLMDFLVGNPDTNGIWSPSLLSGTGVFNPKNDKEGSYAYMVDNGYCTDESIVTVKFSGEATDVDIDVVDNSRNNSIAINASGIGVYEYSIDGVNFQDQSLFENLEPGLYTVYIKDKNGCGVKEFEKNVLGYSKFFTPNGDGYNDYWNIKGGEKTLYTINIYDRFGKLLKSLNSLSTGWDGKFNNLDMPTSDYWFVFKTSEGREITGHFSLKR